MCLAPRFITKCVANLQYVVKISIGISVFKGSFMSYRIENYSQEDQDFLDNLFKVFSYLAAGDHVFVCDVKNDVSRWSKDAVDYFGLPDEYMKNAGMIWSEYIHPDDRKTFIDNIDSLLSGIFDSHDMQYRAKNLEGNYVTCTCRGVVIKGRDGKPLYFGGAIHNNDEAVGSDMLTGLKSPSAFQMAIKYAILNKQPTVFMAIRCCKFSHINNMYGYNIGNHFLQHEARSLQKRFGSKGEVFRGDGPSFTIACRGMSVEEIKQIYEDETQELLRGVKIDGHTINVSIASGLLALNNFDIAHHVLITCLNYATNESRHHKQGDLVIFNNSEDLNQTQKLKRLGVIRDSIANECRGFYLCYQAVVDAQTEKLSGCEALIRWKNDTYGMVPPNEFIDILEQDNLFPQLGLWIIKRAMLDTKEIIKVNPNFVTNVNLSYSQLEKADFINSVVELLTIIGLPGRNLCFEITERCRLLDIELLKDAICKLGRLGIKFALDDFGTGFASLDILKYLPVDIVKIDRSFILDMESDERSKIGVKSIIELASAYGAHVCAEGIENAQTRDILCNYKVNTLQGYYYSKPIEINQFCQKFFPGSAICGCL